MMIKLKNVLIEKYNEEENISLYYKEGNSDKVYTAILQREADGWVVNAQWGRRGSTMQTGTKTNLPVSYDDAKKIYDTLVKSKLAKGYSPGKDAPIYTSNTNVGKKKIETSSKEVPSVYADSDNEKRKTGIYPQLLNVIGNEQLESYLSDNNYGAQEKYDGKRILIDINENGSNGINRKGLSVEIPEEIAFSLKSLLGKIIDGELVGTTYYVFDLLRDDNKEIKTLPYRKRYSKLENINFKGNVILAPLAIGEKQKRELYDSLKKSEKEGIVFKDLNAPYKAGRPATGGSQFKHKFWESCSAIVSKINQKRSVALQLYDGGKLIDVGNVTIPPNKEIPNVGDVVEIKYLYAYRGGSLYQPQYLNVRDDIDRIECKTSQLKYKND